MEGKRKFILAVFAMVLVTILPLTGNEVVEKMYSEAVSGLVFLYLSFGGANVAEHFANRKKPVA
jgi:hypothetical protein